MSEFLRRLSRNKLALYGSLGSLLLGSGGTAAGLLLTESPVKKTAVPADCTSPREIQQDPPFYPGVSGAKHNDQKDWVVGVRIRTTVPAGTRGVIFGFSDPRNIHWIDSYPMDPLHGQNALVKIGDGDVMWSTEIEAPWGSPLCDTRPRSTFSKEGVFDYMYDFGGSKPVWPSKPSS